MWLKTVIISLLAISSLQSKAQEKYTLKCYDASKDQFYTNSIPSNQLDSLKLEQCKPSVEHFCDSIFSDICSYKFVNIHGLKARKRKDELDAYPRIDSKHSAVRYTILLNDFLQLRLYFKLDSNYQIECSPKNLTQDNAQLFAQFQSFEKFEQDVLNYKKGFIHKIAFCDLKYDSEKEIFYYQVKGHYYGKKQHVKKAKWNKKLMSWHRKYNYLHVDPISGEILQSKKTTSHENNYY